MYHTEAAGKFRGTIYSQISLNFEACYENNCAVIARLFSIESLCRSEITGNGQNLNSIH